MFMNIVIQLMILTNIGTDKRLIMDSSVDTYYVFKAVYKSTAIVSEQILPSLPKNYNYSASSLLGRTAWLLLLSSISRRQ